MTEEYMNECEEAEMYVLGGMDAEDRAAFEAHLETCPRCAALVEELQVTMDLLPLAAEPIEVPEGMKNRILGNILGQAAKENHVRVQAGQAESDVPVLAERDEAFEALNMGFGNTGSAGSEKSGASLEELIRDTSSGLPPLIGQPPAAPDAPVTPNGILRSRVSRRPRIGRWLNAALAAAVILLGVYGLNLRSQVDRLHTELDAASGPVQGLKTNEAVSLSAAAKDIVAQGLATIVIDGKGTHLLVQAEKLPQLQGNQAFQVWLMKDGKQVLNAGTFISYKDTGALYFTLEGSEAEAGYNQIAITLEPDANGTAPRGTPVLTASIRV